MNYDSILKHGKIANNLDNFEMLISQFEKNKVYSKMWPEICCFLHIAFSYKNGILYIKSR